MRLGPLLFCLGVIACTGSSTSPAFRTDGCSSRTTDPTYGCAFIDATVLTPAKQPAVAFLSLANADDTTRFRVVSAITDATGRAVVDIRKRQAASSDTASVLLLVQTPPASSTGAFWCIVQNVPLRFRGNGSIPDTLHVIWPLADPTVTHTSECGD